MQSDSEKEKLQSFIDWWCQNIDSGKILDHKFIHQKIPTNHEFNIIKLNRDLFVIVKAYVYGLQYHSLELITNKQLFYGTIKIMVPSWDMFLSRDKNIYLDALSFKTKREAQKVLLAKSL